MENVTAFIYYRLFWLWLVALLGTQMMYGTQGVLILVAGVALACGWYWWLVVDRPKPAPASAYIGNFYGQDFMEGRETWNY